ncbi:YfbM family protein [Micromonospora sp. NPDC049523]|uniref:YfbM family protein n=1 Tax=Micromonospora sp. NPDC049523 TaxID=3155921 RepID=UPI00342E5C7C
MNGNWLRVTPAELARAKDDLEWAYELAEAAGEAADDRSSGTGKAWQALDFLLRRRGFGVPIVEGAAAFVDPSDDDFAESDQDWGYGPPSYLTPEQVASAAAELATITPEDLIRGVDPAELQHAEIYPNHWDRPDELVWVAHFLPDARRFFATAARRGAAVICWID